jgi:hypothetical protein
MMNPDMFFFNTICSIERSKRNITKTIKIQTNQLILHRRQLGEEMEPLFYMKGATRL